MITVEIWSDILCPFCYIGKHRFQAALSAFPGRDQVQVQFRSFELDPNAKRHYKVGIYELLAQKYGRTLEWAREANANLAQQAQAMGLQFDFDRLIPTNSFDAHRLVHFARSKGREDAMLEELFAAYFCKGEHIGEAKTLEAIAVRVGLDAAEAAACIQGKAFSDEVRHDEDEASQLGLTGVPAFVCNRQYLISGAQPEAVFVDALTKLASQQP